MENEKYIQAVLFDIDDTLIPTTAIRKELINFAINHMMAEGLTVDKEGKPVSLEQVLNIFWNEIYPIDKNSGTHFNDLCYLIKGEYIWSIISAGVDAHRKARPGSIRTRKYVKPCLEKLEQERYKLGVITFGKPLYQSSKLRDAGIIDFFIEKDMDTLEHIRDNIYASVGKDKRELILEASKKMGFNPEYAVTVADRLEDLLPAKELGGKTIRLKRGKYKEETENTVVDRMIEEGRIEKDERERYVKLVTPDHICFNFKEVLASIYKIERELSSKGS